MENKEKNNLGILILFAISAPLILGFTFMCLWNWYIPAVFNLDKLNLVQAVGITLVYKTLIGGKIIKDEDRDIENIKAAFKNLINFSLVALFYGFIFSLFI
jgi:hypothetical protein